MTTVADLIEETLHKLTSNQRELLNRLASDIDNLETSVMLEFPLEGVRQNARVCVGVEEMHVWQITSESNRTFEAQRGFRGSTPVAHTTGELVQVNPRFSSWHVFKAIQEEVQSLVDDGLYRMQTVDITYSSSVAGYDLTGVTDILGTPYKVLREQTGPEEYWPEILEFSYSSDLPTDEFPSGKAIFLWRGALPGETLRVWYKSGFTIPTSLTDDVTAVTGVPDIAHDILVWGAASRLAPARVVARTDINSQGDARRASEVSPADVLRSGAALREERDRRIQGEIMRLNRLYPQKV